MFLSDITLGSSPTIEIGIEPNFAGLGSYDFGAFVSGSPRPVFLTNDAEMYDGVNVAFGTVRVSVAAIPESDVAWLMGVGLLLVMFAGKRRFT